MRFVLLLISFLQLFSFYGFGQKVTSGSLPRAMPIFGNRADSLLFEKLDRVIQANIWRSSMKTDRALDSLFEKHKMLYGKAIGHRYVYRPQFVLLDSLTTKEERKFANSITIYKLKADRLPPELFECENLERLELLNTSINLIQSDIEKLKELKTLEIYNNEPQEKLCFDENGTITHLIIRSEKRNKIPTDYQNLKALEILDLCHSGLVRFPSIKKNKNLIQLLLVDNAIKQVKVNGWKLPSIKKIDLRYNQLKTLHGSIGKIKSLQTLFLNFNEISKVKRGVGRLKNLEYLSVYQNQLIKIPNAFYQLTGLINLDVYYNYIEHIQPALSNWKKLSVLHIANNRLYDLPSTIGDLANLREIYAYSNRLTTLPESLAKLTALRVLRVNENYLTSFPGQTLSMPLLQQLDISNNRISKLPIAIFKFENFQIIGLKSNPWSADALALIDGESKKLKAKNVVILLDE